MKFTAALLAFLALTSTAAAFQATTTRVSVATGGAQGNGNSDWSSISADGRFVAFKSLASNLVVPDTNGTWDIFVRDLQLGTTERVSEDSFGVQANGVSGDQLISADGRFVAFDSLANNLVVGDTNGRRDVFVHDRQLDTTERVSVVTGGAQGNNNSAYTSISADGRFVAFHSLATNFVAPDTNGNWDTFVHDRQLGTTERVSEDSFGVQGNGLSNTPFISAGGRFVGFTSLATNLVPGDTNGVRDVFVHDRQLDTTERVSEATGGAQGDSDSYYPWLSADGRFVAFFSFATSLVAVDTNVAADVFVRDRQLGTTELVSVDSSGAQGNGDSVYPSISDNGQFVAFGSLATNLVASDTNGSDDIFVRNRQLGTTERVSVAWDGAQGNAAVGLFPSISADGRFVAFYSFATNLVAGDTNVFQDAFVRDRGAPPPPVPYCFGDGTGTACPCGNGLVGNGCPNSVNANGANLAASGTASTTADTFVLAGSGMPNSSALYFQGTAQVAGGAGVVFGDGLRCAGGSVIRLGTKLNSGGASQYPEALDPSVSVRGVVTAPGIRTYQVWYRNAAAFCTVATFNLTNGLEVAWTF